MQNFSFLSKYLGPNAAVQNLVAQSVEFPPPLFFCWHFVLAAENILRGFFHVSKEIKSHFISELIQFR